jgi:hypothetical protein
MLGSLLMLLIDRSIYIYTVDYLIKLHENITVDYLIKLLCLFNSAYSLFRVKRATVVLASYILVLVGTFFSRLGHSPKLNIGFNLAFKQTKIKIKLEPKILIMHLSSRIA